MQRSQRIGLIVAAVIVVVAAIVIIGSGGDDDSSDSGTTAETTTAGGGAPAAAEVPTIVIKNDEPVGGEQDLEVDKGDTLEFRVKSDADHEIHLHGYDVAKDVAAGGQATYKLTAEIDGIFEIEIEDTKTPIAELTVNP